MRKLIAALGLFVGAESIRVVLVALGMWFMVTVLDLIPKAPQVSLLSHVIETLLYLVLPSIALKLQLSVRQSLLIPTFKVLLVAISIVFWHYAFDERAIATLALPVVAFSTALLLKGNRAKSS